MCVGIDFGELRDFGTSVRACLCKMSHHERKSSLTLEGEKVVCVERSGSLTIISPLKESDRRRGSLLARYCLYTSFYLYSFQRANFERKNLLCR